MAADMATPAAMSGEEPALRQRRSRLEAPRMSVLLSRVIAADGRAARRSLQVKKAVEFNPFEADGQKDPEESEFKLQHLLIGLEDAVLRVHLQAPPGVQLSPRVVLGLERAVRRARDFLKGGASCRLLRCINRVISSTRPGVRQRQLQLIFLKLRLPEKATKVLPDLPSAMTSPRTLGHASDRLRHFGRLRAACDLGKHRPPMKVHLVSPANDVDEFQALSPPMSRVASEVLYSPPVSRAASEQESFARAASASAPSVAVRPGSRLSVPGATWRTLWPELPQDTKVSAQRCPSASTATGPISRALSHSSCGGSSNTEPRLLSRTSSLLQPRADSRRGSRTGVISEMARSSRLYELGGHACELAISAESSSGKASDESSQTMSRRPSMASDALLLHAAAVRPQDSVRRPVPIPQLEGKTSGFAAKDPVHPCPWLSKPPKKGWPKAELIFTKSERAIGAGSRAISPAETSPVAHPRLLGTERGLGTAKDGKVGGHGSGLSTPKASCSVKSWFHDSFDAAPHFGDLEGGLDTQGWLERQVGDYTLGLLELRSSFPLSPSSSSGRSSRRANSHHTQLEGDSRQVGSMPDLFKELRVLPRERALPLPSCSTGGPVFGEASLPERLWQPEVSYMQGCVREKVAPWLGVKFFSSRPQKLNLDSMLMSDGDLQALLEALREPLPKLASPHQLNVVQTPAGGHFSAITELSLANNRRLGDAALARFFSGTLLSTSLGGHPCIGPLRILCLAACRGLGAESLETLSRLFAYAEVFGELEELDLSSICIPRASWNGFVEGLGQRQSLRIVRLARTECGRGSQQPCALAATLVAKCRTLQVIDLSGNYFRHEGCRAVAEGLQAASTELRELDLSHNAGFASPDASLPDAQGGDAGKQGAKACGRGEAPRFNPIMHVLSVLGETTLRRVSFANCQLSFQEDCVLEDVVGSSEIAHLDVSDNPHGEEGLRCLMRLLTRCCDLQKGGKLEFLELGIIRDNLALDNGPSYDYRDPSACYSLALRKPHHRSLLRLLLKRAEEATGAGGKEFECFEHVLLDKQPTSLQSLCGKRLDRGGDDWRVPDRGALAFQFKFPLFYDPLDSARAVMVKFARIMSVKVSFKAFARIKTLFKALQDVRSQRLLLCAMSKDLCFKLPQVLDLAKATSELYLDAVASLLPAVEEQPPTHKALFDVLDSCKGRAARQQLRQAKVDSRSLIYFNYQHPDGNYSLDLSNEADRGTAQRCIVVSGWMKHQSLAKSLLDCSEFGNHESMRNTAMCEKCFRFDSSEWQLPVQGTFSFDFVFPRLPLTKENASKDSSVIVIAQMVQESPCSFRDQLCALRSVAHHLTLTPEQLRRLVEIFPAWTPLYEAGPSGQCLLRQPRAEAYVSLYNRTLYHSEVVSPKLLYNERLLHRDESQAIQRRLGWIHTFDLLKCHSPRSNLGNRHGPMSMVAHDGWAVVKALVMVSLSEKGPHFDDCMWSERKDFYERGYPFVIPSTWVPDPPHVGELTVGVITKPEEANYTRRREVAAQLLGWTFRPAAPKPVSTAPRMVALGAAKARV